MEEGRVLDLSQSFFDNSFEMDGRMTSSFTSFSIVYQSYKDDGRVIHVMIHACKRIPLAVEISVIFGLGLACQGQRP